MTKPKERLTALRKELKRAIGPTHKEYRAFLRRKIKALAPKKKVKK